VLARNKLDHSVSVFRADTGTPISRREAQFFGGRIDFPAWSPTGSELVATRASLVGQPDMQQSANDGELVILPFDGSNVGMPQVLLSEPGSFVNSYPSWSPDGQWIVFTSSPVGSETLGNRQTRLRLINLATRGVRDLGYATYGLDKGSKFARFAPTGLDGCRTVFITFQSGLDYGVLRRNTVEWPQLWMSAIDLANLTSDPSSPPVWLPFQDHRQKNLLPAWSEIVPCEPDCGPGATCDFGRAPSRCVPM
jgi:dipeptidyl aminopeptidase/acylaminoacyl peptidase